MDDRALTTTEPVARLSGVGQLYVTTVAVVSMLTVVEGSHAWYVALIALALPLSLLALWVGFYAGLALGLVVGQDLSWPLVLVWVAVWTTTAWLNAQVAQKVLRLGWAALRVGPRMADDEDE